nr:putative ribonuclease H-like domain-containing protein [Tanacetum cinerariifolium]
MVKLEKPLKKKDQIVFDEEVTRKLDAQMKAKMEEEEMIAREKDEANRTKLRLLRDEDRKYVVVNAARPINTDYPRSTVNVVSVVQGNRENVVNFSACWIWRPTGNVINHISKDSKSYMLKRFNYVDLQRQTQDQGIFYSGCSRHMTGNKSFLTDYQEIDGGFVTFGESPKGDKISGKGKIRIGKLNFEDVYFVHELKFNLFSVSQMCNKKNSVLFIETECLVLSPDFKLLDENQVLLKVPKQNNMYSFDLKNVAPLGDHLGKFERKADEGFLVGYSVNSRAFRVFNSRTRKVEENLHIRFLENKSNVAGRGLEWHFDIDSLIISMNYEPVIVGNQTNNDAGIEIHDNAGQAGQEKVSDHKYILLPFMPLIYHSLQVLRAQMINMLMSTQDVNTDGPSINTANTNINNGSLNINIVGSNDPSMPSLEETGIFDDVYDDREVGAEANTYNLELSTVVSPIPTTRVYKDHPKEQIIRHLNLATQTWRMINFSKENFIVSYINKQRKTNHKDYQNCLLACFLSQIEPKKVIQTLTYPSWIEAMQEELLQFKLQKVWTLVDLFNSKRVIGTKWVFRNKKDEIGIVIRNKARLVVQDDAQEILNEFYEGAHFLFRVADKAER